MRAKLEHWVEGYAKYCQILLGWDRLVIDGDWQVDSFFIAESCEDGGLRLWCKDL